MDAQKVEFVGHAGDRLAARLDMPAGAPRAYALFAHCFTCGKDLFAASRISATLVERGFAVLRFDFTGLGMSEGDFANTSFSSNVEDLVRAASFLRERYQAPAVLIGHSLGGAAVLAAAEHVDEARAVVTIGAPAEPSHVRRLFAAQEDAIREEGEVEVTLAGRSFRITRRFLEDLDATRIRERVGRLRRALLVMHSPIDDVVGIDNARLLYEAARHPKSFVSLDDADHLLRKRRDADYAASVLAAWAGRYLSADEDAPGPPAGPRDADSLEAGVVEVSETGTGRYANQVRAGRHRLSADEPEDLGGTDTGPSPYDYLLASLGACTSMTLRMYAERKGLALERVSVRLRHRRVHADDCSDCESKRGQVAELERVISLRGDLSDAERARLLEIADKCPVHRTLAGEIKIRTRASDEPR
ncbi:MAG: OsmC family protein [Phycisphaerales bacterium]|nr:OsmC family protein [Phycisphaerales bacterium]MCA9531477.1 OsmC family protein [Myxococcales bacterium]